MSSISCIQGVVVSQSIKTAALSLYAALDPCKRAKNECSNGVVLIASKALRVSVWSLVGSKGRFDIGSIRESADSIPLVLVPTVELLSLALDSQGAQLTVSANKCSFAYLCVVYQLRDSIVTV